LRIPGLFCVTLHASFAGRIGVKGPGHQDAGDGLPCFCHPSCSSASFLLLNWHQEVDERPHQRDALERLGDLHREALEPKLGQQLTDAAEEMPVGGGRSARARMRSASIVQVPGSMTAEASPLAWIGNRGRLLLAQVAATVLDLLVSGISAPANEGASSSASQPSCVCTAAW